MKECLCQDTFQGLTGPFWDRAGSFLNQSEPFLVPVGSILNRIGWCVDQPGPHLREGVNYDYPKKVEVI